MNPSGIGQQVIGRSYRKHTVDQLFRLSAEFFLTYQNIDADDQADNQIHKESCHIDQSHGDTAQGPGKIGDHILPYDKIQIRFRCLQKILRRLQQRRIIFQ